MIETQERPWLLAVSVWYSSVLRPTVTHTESRRPRESPNVCSPRLTTRRCHSDVHSIPLYGERLPGLSFRKSSDVSGPSQNTECGCVMKELLNLNSAMTAPLTCGQFYYVHFIQTWSFVLLEQSNCLLYLNNSYSPRSILST